MNYCQCKCGKLVKRKWSKGHNRKGTTFKLSNFAKEKMRLSKLGSKNPRFGILPWNKGKKMSEETRQKVKLARAKQVFTIEHRRNMSRGLKMAYQNGTRTDIGEKKWNWKGGTRSKTHRIRNSLEMKLWREAVFARDNFTCQECKIRGGQLQAHHIKPFSSFPELRFAIDNGQTLCVDCHKKTDTYLKFRKKL